MTIAGLVLAFAFSLLTCFTGAGAGAASVAVEGGVDVASPQPMNKETEVQKIERKTALRIESS